MSVRATILLINRKTDFQSLFNDIEILRKIYTVVKNRVASIYRVYIYRISIIRSKRREKFATKIKLLNIYLVYVY